jgi:predicted nucleotidyltransferase
MAGAGVQYARIEGLAMVSMKHIRQAAERIGREFRPDKVILFGSYAYGTPTADSDVDLLVILPCRGNPVHKAVDILAKAEVRFPVDLLVRTPGEVRRRLAWNDFFLREVIEKGRVLYESPDSRMGRKGRGRPGHRRARTPRPKVAEL